MSYVERKFTALILETQTIVAAATRHGLLCDTEWHGCKLCPRERQIWYWHLLH